jgi:A/G-specific adenine glycosylase
MGEGERSFLMSCARIVNRLLVWFSRNARDLPWRHTCDPYAIWVSEIMLQQTQVNTVIPYWERWMRLLPDVKALAKLSPSLLHKLWEGLGYYSRARNLHHSARMLVAQKGGRLPTTLDGWLAMPGVGRYTAGAICSLAFDQPEPILDGNVARVLARLFTVSGSPRKAATNAELWRLAGQLVRSAERTRLVRGAGKGPPAKPAVARPCSGLNQALMELGALICTPRRPRCGLCPVARLCQARHEGRVADFPQRDARPKVTPRAFVVLLAEKNGRFLVRRRPAGVVNAQLWEFPNVELLPPQAEPGGLIRAILGQDSQIPGQLYTVRHSITRYRITLQAYRIPGSDLPGSFVADGKWLDLNQMRRLAFAGGHKRILEHLGFRANGWSTGLASRQPLRPRKKVREMRTHLE